MYIYNHVHTYYMWVNEVFLDRRMTILHFFAYFVMCYSSWVDPLVFIGFSLFWRWFSIFFIVFFHYMVQPKVIMPPWWKDMGFKKKNCVPREKSGRHSNLIYLVLNPLKKSGTAFSDFSLFSRCCSLFFKWFFIIFKVCFIIFHWFFNVVTCVSLFFIVFWVYVFCNLHAYSAYLQYHIHGRHRTVENASKFLEFLGFQD